MHDISAKMYVFLIELSDKISSRVIHIIADDFDHTPLSNTRKGPSIKSLIETSVSDLIDKVKSGNIPVPHPILDNQIATTDFLRGLTTDIEFYDRVTSDVLLMLLVAGQRHRIPMADIPRSAEKSDAGNTSDGHPLHLNLPIEQSFEEATCKVHNTDIFEDTEREDRSNGASRSNSFPDHYDSSVTWQCKGVSLPNGQPVHMVMRKHTFYGRLVVKDSVSGIIVEDGSFFHTLRDAATYSRASLVYGRPLKSGDKTPNVNGWSYWKTKIGDRYYTMNELRHLASESKTPDLTALMSMSHERKDHERKDHERKDNPITMWSVDLGNGVRFSAPDRTRISMTYGGRTFTGLLTVRAMMGKYGRLAHDHIVYVNQGSKSFRFDSLDAAASYCVTAVDPQKGDASVSLRSSMACWKTECNDGVWRSIEDQVYGNDRKYTDHNTLITSVQEQQKDENVWLYRGVRFPLGTQIEMSYMGVRFTATLVSKLGRNLIRTADGKFFSSLSKAATYCAKSVEDNENGVCDHRIVGPTYWRIADSKGNLQSIKSICSALKP